MPLQFSLCPYTNRGHPRVSSNMPDWGSRTGLLAAARSVTFVIVWKTSHRPPSAIFVSRTRYNNYTFWEGGGGGLQLFE